MVISGDGTYSSHVGIPFTYATDTIPSERGWFAKTRNGPTTLGGPVELTIAGDLLGSSFGLHSARSKGADTIETHRWHAPIGASI